MARRPIKALSISVAFMALCLFCWTAANLQAGVSGLPEDNKPQAEKSAASAPDIQAKTNSVPGLNAGDLTDKITPKKIEKVYTGERISVDFQNADIHNILKIIAEVAGKNIVVSDGVTGKLTLKVKDAPWDQIWDVILASSNLEIEEYGDVLKVYEVPRVSRYRASIRCCGPLDKKVFTPKYASISAVTVELKKIKSKRGKIVAIGNDIYVEDEHIAISAMDQLFKRIDQEERKISDNSNH